MNHDMTYILLRITYYYLLKKNDLVSLNLSKNTNVIIQVI